MTIHLGSSTGHSMTSALTAGHRPLFVCGKLHVPAPALSKVYQGWQQCRSPIWPSDGQHPSFLFLDATLSQPCRVQFNKCSKLRSNHRQISYSISLESELQETTIAKPNFLTSSFWHHSYRKKKPYFIKKKRIR